MADAASADPMGGINPDTDLVGSEEDLMRLEAEGITLEEPEVGDEEGEPDEPDGDAGDLDEEEEEEEEEVTQPTPEEETKPEAEVTPRANKRIQGLISKNKELEAQIQEQQQQFQQQLAWFQQQQAEQQEKYQKEQLELSRRQLEMIQERQRKEEEKDLSEYEKFRMGLLSETKSELDKVYSQRIAELENKIQQSELQREQAAKQAESAANVNRFKSQSQSVVNDVLLKDLNSDWSDQEKEEFANVVMVYAAAFKKPPLEVASSVRKLMDRFHSSKLQSRVKGGDKHKVKAPIVTKKAPMRKNGFPTQKQLRAMGLDSPFDWVALGEPEVPAVD